MKPPATDPRSLSMKMRAVRRRLVAFALLMAAVMLAAAPLNPGRAHGAPAPGAVEARLDALFKGLVQAQAFSGAVLVAQNGHIVFNKAYGMADLAHNIPNTPSTEFTAAETLTGQFTAAAILQLQEQGKLRVQDCLCAYIPSCPKAWQPITIQELLDGSSGIFDYVSDPTIAATLSRPMTSAQLIALIAKYPVTDKPGVQCGLDLAPGYDGSYPLLGAIVARVAGESMATYLRQHFLAPLGLRHTGIDPTDPRAPQHAVGYASWGQPPVPAIDLSTLYATDDIYSTVGDLYRWDQALLSGKVLSQVSRKAMFTPACTFCPFQCMPGQQAGGAGDAWEVGVLDNRRYAYLGGSLPLRAGFMSLELYYVDQRTTFIVLSNLGNADDSFYSQMEQIVLG